MIIKVHLWTNPGGRNGGADFEAEAAPGSGALHLMFRDGEFPPEARSALAQLESGLHAYAANPNPEFGPLPSGVFRVSKLHGDPTAHDLSVFRLAGCFAARDFHRQVHGARPDADSRNKAVAD